jgi:hypothetical protein
MSLNPAESGVPTKNRKTRPVSFQSRIGLLVGVVGLLALAGCSNAPSGTSAQNTGGSGGSGSGATAQSAPAGASSSVPNVSGQELDQAEATLQSDNLGYQTFGGGTFGVVIASNWTVCSQTPAAGSTARSVNLVVARECTGNIGGTGSTGSTP